MVNLLGRVPLFEGCTRLDLSRVASLSEERIYREGQVIVKAGDPGKAFYVITNGKAKVVAGTTPGGKKEAELGRGEFFGELSLLDGDSRSRTVVAETAAGSTLGWAAGTGAIIVACGGATSFFSSTSGSAFGSSALGVSAILGGVSAEAGISSTSHDPHQRHLIAASLISSAQYGQVFIGALLPCSA